MSIRQVKAWTITCTGAYGTESLCHNRNLGPFFAEYEHEVPTPHGWGYRTLNNCGLTGYTRSDLWCDECIKRHGIVTDEAREVVA